MKERPILFSGPMVRAILEGRKTQTRRVVKPQPVGHLAGPNFDGLWSDTVDPVARYFACPYGQPGDRLWVRETWGLMCYHDPTDWCSGSVKGVPESELRERYTVEHAANWKLPSESAHWRPSIHMPRWASRITLEIVSVRVERLNEITEEDAKKEGADRVVMPERGVIHNPLDQEDEAIASHRNGFQFIWECCYGLESWDENPWVWVVEFRRVEK